MGLPLTIGAIDHHLIVVIVKVFTHIQRIGDTVIILVGDSESKDSGHLAQGTRRTPTRQAEKSSSTSASYLVVIVLVGQVRYEQVWFVVGGKHVLPARAVAQIVNQALFP